MDPARNGVKDDEDRSMMRRCRRDVAAWLACAMILLGAATTTEALVGPKPSPSPNPMVGQLDDAVDQLRQINATLATLRTSIDQLGGRLDELEQLSADLNDVKATTIPMREEVRGLYVETSNVRSEIARLEEKSVAEAESLGKSRYVLTLLLVATMVLQVVVLAALLRR
ncbi:MAG: hypothetical protein FJ148_15165 [Deltaproteobacteria bacterium]|nr:hypothetical protein [Deltaproteobacteria bacterium]